MEAKYVLKMSTLDHVSGFGEDFEPFEVNDDYIACVKEEGIDWLSDFLGEDFDDDRIIDIVEDYSPEDTLLSAKIYRLDEDGEREDEPVFEASKWLSEAAQEYYDENELYDKAAIESIEGLHEITKADGEWKQYTADYNYSVKTGWKTTLEKPTSDLDALIAKYPRAMAYLIATERAESPNNDMADDWRKVRRLIIDGEDYEQAFEETKNKWKRVHITHYWDL